MNWEVLFRKILEKIAEREAVYKQTWMDIPTADLLAVARVKTYRATTMLQTDNTDKLEDDIIDAIAYLLFSLAKLHFR